MAAAPTASTTPVGVIISTPMKEREMDCEMDCIRSGAAAPNPSCAGDHGRQGTAAHECSSVCEFIRRGIWLARLAKVVAITVIVAACTFWLGWWILSPEPEARHKYVDIWIGDKTANSRFFNTDGQQGSSLIFHAFPFVVVAMLSFVVIHLRASIRAKEAQLQRRQCCNNMATNSLHADHAPDMGAGGVDQQISAVLKGNSTSSWSRWQLSTYPLWVSTSGSKRAEIIARPLQLGIITAAEALGILVFLLVIAYHLGRSVDLNFHRIAGTNRAPSIKYWQKVNSALRLFGEAALLPFALLWIPVSRGSPLLRAARIPFERAVRYHIWLSICMIVLLSVHSLGYIIMYTATGKAHTIVEWETRGERCAVAAGLAAWIVALVMLLTSLPPVRRRCYELFFFTHHLYLLFALLWMYHVVSHLHFFVVPMLLFFVDRFLRMLQSARPVRVSAAHLHADGVVELTLPLPPLPAKSDSKAAFMHYNALSTWCVQIPGISAMQWHFFSSTSSPLDGSGAISILIKPLGGWTNALRRQFLPSDAVVPAPIRINMPTTLILGSNKSSGADTAVDNTKSPADHPQYNDSVASSASGGAGPVYSCPFSFKARVDGPYGDESDFYLKYKSLVLVAGGIGITPALAILRDVLYRYKRQYGVSSTSSSSGAHARRYYDSGTIAGQLPSSITIYHCIRRLEELHVLDYVCPDQILPGYDALGLRIQVHVYVTGQYSSSTFQLAPGSADDHVALAAGDRNQAQSPAAIAGSLLQYNYGHGHRQMSCILSLRELWELRRQQRIMKLAPTSSGDPSKSSSTAMISACSSHGTAGSSSAPLVFLPAGKLPGGGAGAAAVASISRMSSTGDAAWVGCVTMAAIVGYFVLSGVANILIIGSSHHQVLNNSFTTNYNRVHVAVACMAMGIVLFGGLVLCLWTISSSRAATAKSSSKEEIGRSKLQGAMVSSSSASAVVQPMSHSVGTSPIYTLDHGDQHIINTPYHESPADQYEDHLITDGEADYAGVAMAKGDAHIGCRPDWRDVFDGLARTHSMESVGVLVSGSQGMQEDVARECRRHSSSTLFNRVKKFIGANNTPAATDANVIFHYHSISFSL